MASTEIVIVSVISARVSARLGRHANISHHWVGASPDPTGKECDDLGSYSIPTRTIAPDQKAPQRSVFVLLTSLKPCKGGERPFFPVFGIETKRVEAFARRARVRIDLETQCFQQKRAQINFRTIDMVWKIVIFEVDEHFRAGPRQFRAAGGQENTIDISCYILENRLKRDDRWLFDMGLEPSL